MRVYDGVFTPAACALLHTAACSRGLGHNLFHRAEPRSVIEAALDSFLDEIDDQSPYCEFWSRQEWKHIEAHADVDERRAAALPKEPLRFPTNGHVLYLSVGSRVRGPTCVWEPDGSASQFGALATVPAVEGRVLRFDGHLQHAVPKPADVWLAPFAINPSGTPEELVRSVILFNTWDEPPLDVVREAESNSGDDVGAARCAPRSSWAEAPEQRRPAPGESGCSGATKTMKLWLLGDEVRRGRPERTLPLQVDGAAVLAALDETSTVTHLAPASAAAAAGAAAPAPPPASRATALAAALQRAAEQRKAAAASSSSADES